jgi:hypothetical protein
VGTETCNDGVDNTCDRAIDCGDPKCSGNALCTGLPDGKPCLLDGQCAGATCLTEAATGSPNGSCTNLAPCNLASGAGCNGGRCTAASATVNRCFAPCTGTGLGTTGACRAGFACFDPDYNTTNNNNLCLPSCTSDSECAGMGTGYGCNPWSKTCTTKDRGLAKYGAACTADAQCETNLCLTGANWPTGYCAGDCRGDLRNCALGGYCTFNPAYGDNWGTCAQQCAGSPSSTACRAAGNYTCWLTSPGSSTGTCYCLSLGTACDYHADCCSNHCSILGNCN